MATPQRSTERRRQRRGPTGIRLLAGSLLLAALDSGARGEPTAARTAPSAPRGAMGDKPAKPEAPRPPEAPRELGEAIFAGGCFWCVETAFEGVPGVKEVISGFAGGDERHVTYEQVSTGRTGHAEAVRILYDPSRITYAELLERYWRNIDPLTADGQFCDKGRQYRTAIFFLDESQRQKAEASRRVAEQRLGRPLVTEIVRATEFWPADDHHQDFYKKSPDVYRRYRAGSGRDRRLQELWGRPGDTPPGSAH